MTEPDPPVEGRNTGRLDDPTQLDDVAAEGTSEELPVVQGRPGRRRARPPHLIHSP
jgi:hypothetical protein